MFAKLLKHEFRAQKKTFFILSLAALGVGILGCLIMWFLLHSSASSEAAEIIGGSIGVIGIFGIVLSLLAYGLAVWIMLLLRFYRHHFTGEGYLTFTIPATTTQVLWASIVNIIIWVAITSLVMAVSVGLILTPLVVEMTQLDDYTYNMVIDIFKETYVAAFEQLDVSILSYIFSAIASMTSSLMLPLLCITIGSIVAKKHKLLASFGIYYGINLAVSMLSGILSAVTTLAQTMTDLNRAYNYSIIMPAIINLCIGVGSYCLMHHLISKKLNL